MALGDPAMLQGQKTDHGDEGKSDRREVPRVEQRRRERDAPGVWRLSAEHKTAWTFSALAFFVVLGAAVGAITWSIRYSDRAKYNSGLDVTVVFTGIGLMVLAFVLPVVIYTVFHNGWQERQLATRARADVDDALSALQAEMSLANLWGVNRKQMNAYHVITQAQARDSYFYSKAASITGLLVLIAGAGVAIGVKDVTTKILAGAIASIGATLAGYIGKTFLNIYRNALAQFNWYFEHPLVNSYFLTAERLAGQIKSGPDGDVYRDIIRDVMSCALTHAGAVNKSPLGSLPSRGSTRTSRSKLMKVQDHSELNAPEA